MGPGRSPQVPGLQRAGPALLWAAGLRVGEGQDSTLTLLPGAEAQNLHLGQEVPRGRCSFPQLPPPAPWPLWPSGGWEQKRPPFPGPRKGRGCGRAMQCGLLAWGLGRRVGQREESQPGSPAGRCPEPPKDPECPRSPCGWAPASPAPPCFQTLQWDTPPLTAITTYLPPNFTPHCRSPFRPRPDADKPGTRTSSHALPRALGFQPCSTFIEPAAGGCHAPHTDSPVALCPGPWGGLGPRHSEITGGCSALSLSPTVSFHRARDTLDFARLPSLQEATLRPISTRGLGHQV